MSVSTKYSGFVYAEHAVLPTASDARAVFRMFASGELKKTRALHPLFARGLACKLSLNASEAGLCVSEASGRVVLDSPLHKIYYVAAIEKSLLVFLRRSGYMTSFKCHVFQFASAKVAQQQVEALVRLTNSLGFRRVCRCNVRYTLPTDTQESMSIVPRASSVYSIDMLPDGFIEGSSAPTSTVTSPVGSDNSDEDNDPEQVTEGVPMPASAPQSPAPVAFSEAACGVCLALGGDNWIALKTCGHQFHLPCIAQWRTSHNVCPSCPRVLSSHAFTLRYLGGCFTEDAAPSPAELAELAADYKAAGPPADAMRVQITSRQLVLLDRLGNEVSAVRSSNDLSDLRSVLLLDDSSIAVVFASGSGCLVLLLEPPVSAETPAVHSALRAACVPTLF